MADTSAGRALRWNLILGYPDRIGRIAIAMIAMSSRVLVEGEHARSNRLLAAPRDYFKDAIAGFIASVILIANIVSFSALMFPGELSAGIPVAIWAMLIGSSIGGICIALMTSLLPLATGIDLLTGAVLVLLSTTVGFEILSAGGSAQTAVQTAMLLFSAATLICGRTPVRSRCAALGEVLPICAVFRCGRVFSRNRLVSRYRWHSDDHRPGIGFE